MKAWKIRQYLPNLLLYVQRRLEGGRGSLAAIRIRDVCSIDRRCCAVVQTTMPLFTNFTASLARATFDMEVGKKEC
jgi:hypothetical protein